MVLSFPRLTTAALLLGLADLCHAQGLNQQGFQPTLPVAQTEGDWNQRGYQALSQHGTQVLSQQGFHATLPVVREIPSRPQRGPDGIDSLVQLKGIDGEFEVIAAQARYLILKRDLVRPQGEAGVRPLVAVGHPGVIDIDVIHSRLIRVVGRRVGTTDLTLMTGGNEIYTLRVNVVYDLEQLRGRVAEVFPAAQVPLRQDRETLVVSGMSRDPMEGRNVLRMIQSGINAEQSVILGRSTGGTGAPAPRPAVAPR